MTTDNHHPGPIRYVPMSADTSATLLALVADAEPELFRVADEATNGCYTEMLAVARERIGALTPQDRGEAVMAAIIQLAAGVASGSLS